MALFSKITEFYTPVTGKLIELEKVPDEMFAQKMLGDGFAVEPYENIIRCPIDGKVVMVSENGYAFGLKNKRGIEVLIHIGIDTVNLQGKGFKMMLKDGQNVKAGDKAVELDLDFLKKEQYPITTMIVITSGEKIKSLVKIDKIVTPDEIVATA